LNTIPSTQFRVVYAKLTEPTRVEAYGRSLGVWYPDGTHPESVLETIHFPSGFADHFTGPAPVTVVDTPGTPTVTVRPVPKPGKKAKA
jgi:hypothetical protein